MKILLTAFALLSFNLMASSDLQVQANNIYSPIGFDSNDDTEIFITGTLPSVCYQVPTAVMTKNGNTFTIKTIARVYQGWNPYCEEGGPRAIEGSKMRVPYLLKVQLGSLKQGVYKFIINGNTKEKVIGKIQVERASTSLVDNHVYAPIDTIYHKQGEKTLTLAGYMPSDCYELDKIQVIDNGVDTYSILPILKKVSEFCPMKMTAFEYEMDIPTKLKTNNILIHVRTMEGKSINKLIPRI